jgi:integrase
MAVDHCPSNAKRLGVRLAVYQRRTSILACPTAQDSHQPVALKAGLPSIGWHSFRHTLSAWGKEAGLELEDVKTLLRHEKIATTSEIYGDLDLEAKRRIQQRLINFVKEQVPATIQ